MMNQQMFESWLNEWGRAFVEKDVEAFRPLLAPEAEYPVTSVRPPIRGREAILEATAEDLASLEDISFDYEILAITDEYGIVRYQATVTRQFNFESNYFASDVRETLDGIYQVTLNDAGECTEIQQWRNVEPLESLYAEVFLTHRVGQSTTPASETKENP